MTSDRGMVMGVSTRILKTLSSVWQPLYAYRIGVSLECDIERNELKVRIDQVTSC
jgi:hypothetical protein